MRSIYCLVIATLLSTGSAGSQPVIVMRHGQADHNIVQRHSSNPKHPCYFESHLTAKGREQVAKSAAGILDLGYSADTITAVYVSPLPRARETAQELLELGLISAGSIRYEEALIEIQMGDLEGQSTRDSRYDNSWKHVDGHLYSGETWEDVNARIQVFLERVEDDEGCILLITHGTPSMEIIRLLTGDEVKLPTAGFGVF